ncbi:uncharacterized protein LOC133298171 [Gastrolobium bilobum]|uniref:uncharacterized protein LOC133298171 n=1 Tax=Gastrolobium bilobum TaxID=150636 RepID=UPI002AB122B6|nr:uncharacterized protein LOC133298171 [Gastrolobium bilobum]XP_061353417.1 uncharacterized protein LOC133298171 [Gastrolobium bilobum]
MSGLQGKWKRQDLALAVSASLTNEERIVYNIIRAKKDMGIWSGDIKREMNLPETVFKKSLKLLQSKSLIKEVVNIRNKSRKLFMAAEFEPSNEITGGEWYSEGKLDSEFITHLTSVCLKSIFQLKVATCDGILEWTRKTRIFPVEVTKQQVEQILRILVMDDKILEVKSTGFGDFASIPDGRVCYRLKSKGGVIDGAMASIPCGVCPRIKFCAPNGVVSPTTCVYYQKWLDF